MGRAFNIVGRIEARAGSFTAIVCAVPWHGELGAVHVHDCRSQRDAARLVDDLAQGLKAELMSRGDLVLGIEVLAGGK
jgi:hypothetical protein